jgi:hypothetical protein
MSVNIDQKFPKIPSLKSVKQMAHRSGSHCIYKNMYSLISSKPMYVKYMHIFYLHIRTTHTYVTCIYATFIHILQINIQYINIYR